MINYISSWAEQIIIAVIIVTILEMILPWVYTYSMS